ncbi:Hypothetical predicted protein [Scomber scombrus]|uniref:Uncharacterized protein n=1 Tax=Scomber scombrus TaxID=13677 RepID=A0AAV1MU03_SCOSC
MHGTPHSPPMFLLTGIQSFGTDVAAVNRPVGGVPSPLKWFIGFVTVSTITTFVWFQNVPTSESEFKRIMISDTNSSFNSVLQKDGTPPCLQLPIYPLYPTPYPGQPCVVPTLQIVSWNGVMRQMG